MAAHASGKSFVSHRQLKKLSTRPYSAHELQFDGRSHMMTSDLRPKGSRSEHSSSVDYGSGLSNSLKMSLHESLSEGSLPRYNFSLDDSATIPFGLLYELSEVLNHLERRTLNQLALLLGLTQEQFNRLYQSTNNPAISVMTQGERFRKDLSHLQQAFEILKLDNAIALIEKHHSQIRNKIDAEISNKSVDVDVDREYDRCIISLNSSNSEQLSSSVNFENIFLDSHKNTRQGHLRVQISQTQNLLIRNLLKRTARLSVNESLCACDYIDEEGGILFIPGSSIYLRIPPGALTSGYQIQLSAFMDPAEHGCPRPDDSPRITPLVRCQPDGISFQVPVELVIPHCGVIVEPAKVPVEVYTRPHPDKEGLKPSWVRDEDASSRASLEKTSCSIFLTHFSDYDVVVRDNDCIIGKMLRVFPMINRLSGPADDLLLSLWICNNQQEVYEELIQEQTGDHGRKVLDSYRSFMLLVSNKAVNISYTNFSNQWKVVTAEETIGYHLLWHGSRGVANLRMKSNTESGGGKLSGTLRVQQEENTRGSETAFETIGTINAEYTQERLRVTEEKQRALKFNGSEIHIPPSNGNASHIHVHLPPLLQVGIQSMRCHQRHPNLSVMESVAMGCLICWTLKILFATTGKDLLWEGDSGFSSPVSFVNKCSNQKQPRRKLKLAVNFKEGEVWQRHPSSSSSTSSLSSSTPSSSSLIDFPDSPSTRPKRQRTLQAKPVKVSHKVVTPILLEKAHYCQNEKVSYTLFWNCISMAFSFDFHRAQDYRPLSRAHLCVCLFGVGCDCFLGGKHKLT
ncbi:putative netrin receptor UNC5B [Apostichopus japonicus]|uniref:Netrin receptor UNC5 n=1 Tax=Stichopus japonicus TaxID=307972 RepID=A0A2G8LIV6_STIJA|nr:putative netrin receptor UNC5B [Apostichopus japonicus]